MDSAGQNILIREARESFQSPIVVCSYGCHEVSTESVSDRVTIPAISILVIRCDPVATLYMKGRPSGDSLELFYDFKFGTEGEPYENVLCGNGRASSKYCDRGIEWSRQGSDAISD